MIAKADSYGTGYHCRFKNEAERVNLHAKKAKTIADSVITTTTIHDYEDGTIMKEVVKTISLADKSIAPHQPEVKKTITINSTDKWTLVMMVFCLIIFVTMAYGPIAAFLVEMFPTKIRYSSMSLPYHIGNGIFGGLMPAIATFLATQAHEINVKAQNAGQAAVFDKPYLQGLYYPIIIAGICFIIGLIYINGKDRKIND